MKNTKITKHCKIGHRWHQEGRVVFFIEKISKDKYLGKLCKSKHDWKNTGQSLRYISNGKCCECYKRKIYKTEKKSDNAMYKLNRNVSSAISHSIEGNKQGRHWENLVGYTINDLKQHLEKQFTKGMNWSNYGKWHIDHIKPISSFKFSSPEHRAFKRCWELDNLQPLWATENLEKGSKRYYKRKKFLGRYK